MVDGIGREVVDGAVGPATTAEEAGALPATFRDPALERRLDRDGYVLLPGLGATVLERARELYLTAPVGKDLTLRRAVPALGVDADRTWREHMTPGENWRLSTDACDPADRARIKAEMAPLWDEVAAPVLTGHRMVMNSFMTKFPGPDSFLPLHQDPTVVDERAHRSITVWLALDDINRERDNGALHVLPGSQRCGHEWRGTRTEPSYIGDLERLWAVAQPVDVHAGDVVVMDSRLLHGSPPNSSDRARRAMAGVAAPRDATLVHAVGIDDDRVEIWGVDEQFFCDHGPGSLRDHLPTGYPVLDVVPRADPPTTAKAVLAQQHFERTWRGRQHARLARWKARVAGR